MLGTQIEAETGSEKDREIDRLAHRLYINRHKRITNNEKEDNCKGKESII